ncbi:MAG: helix-turn-helix transcriptional regulator [Clostridia bacterium]|nr:helix-turn-helix transcriptional regulator [Clostridia bacterium]
MNVKANHKDKYIMLGLNIAYYRKLNGFTQERLAEILSLDRTTISKIELATCGVSLDVLFDMADLFHIPVEKLFIFRD